MNFEIKEAYKTLRTNLKFVLTNKGCKKIAICSSEPSEGKSTTSVNLAYSLAEDNNKVLIIDCDMRAGTIHTLFKEKKEKGLSNILCNEIEDISSVIRKTNIPNLYIIQKGDTPPNPMELLSSERMSAVLKECENSYDYIIIDTPPINVVSDVLSLKDKIDGVLFVVRENQSRITELNKSIEQLQFAKMNILGIVMNDSKTKKKSGKYNQYK